jgi:hypothetical protein
MIGLFKRQKTKTKKKQKKAMWHLINEEAGYFPSYDQKIQLKTETGTTTNP